MSRRDSAREGAPRPSRPSIEQGERRKLLYVGDEETGDGHVAARPQQHQSYQATHRPSTASQQQQQQEISRRKAQEEQGQREADEKKKARMLGISFLLMVVVGLMNKIFNKLETIPMHNYPFFISLYSSFVYIPTSFAYIIPMILFGSAISKEERQIPHSKFLVMGGLDSIAGIMQTFATNYLDGSLVIMVQQTAIPISMVLSYMLINARYNMCHILGATVVLGGLLVVLLPQFIGDGAHLKLMDLIWVLTMTVSCVPMTLSSVYKEKALGSQEIDPIYLNGWVALYQFLTSLPMAIPSAYATPGGNIAALPHMIWDGIKCYVGVNTITAVGQWGADQVDECSMSPLYVNIYLVFNIAYNILILLILKYGSANLFWMASALMVPLGSVAFSLPFVPGNKPLGVSGYIGLVVIVLGLVLYRFSHIFLNTWDRLRGREPRFGPEVLDRTQVTSLLHQRGDQIDVSQYIFEGYTYSRQEQEKNLKRGHGSIRSGYYGRLGIRTDSVSSLGSLLPPGSAPQSPQPGIGIYVSNR